MKKVYYIIVAIVSIIFIVFIVNSLPDFIDKLSIVTSDTISSSSPSVTSTFGYKSTKEQEDLLIATLKLNTTFIQNSTSAFDTSDFSIKNFYKLEKFFPNFKHYYSAKLKIKNTIQNEFLTLYNETNNKTETELNTYFNENIADLDTKWGITEFDDFTKIVSSIKQSGGQKVLSCQLEDSYFYINESSLLNFRIILTLENNSDIYIGVKTYMYKTTDYQSAPTIKFYGTAGGTEYV